MTSWMSVAAMLSVLQGLLSMTAGAYFLAFRPLERRALWLGVALVLWGVGNLAWQTQRAMYVVWIVAAAAYFVFAFLFPVRLRWASPAGAAWILAVAMWATTTVYFIVQQLEPLRQVSLQLSLTTRLLSPFALGTATTLLLLMFGRLLSLRDAGITQQERQAAPYLFLLFTAGIFTGGGFEMGHVLGGLLGRTDFPAFFYKTPAGFAYTVIASNGWWVLTGLIAGYGALRLRWWVPTGLLAAGFLSYLPIILEPGLDPQVYVVLRLWGNLLAPAFAMYAQARWAPFEGEPVRAGTGWALALFAGLLVYAFAFIAVLAVASAGVGPILAPLLGLAAAAGMTALVLPQARKLHLQRLFTLAAPDRFAPGTVVLGRYRITRLLGEGGQGRVYEATDRKHRDARVVLKAVTGDDAVHEARILKGLVHPNIVRFVDIVEVPGFTLLVLEFADGGTLRGLLSRSSGRIPDADVAALVDGILSGLTQAHSQGVAHRDIKPENILLADGVPKLADFGVAQPGGVGTTIRTSGRGTLAYMAPEQVRGAPGDARSDVYSMGVLVHEVLTGRSPIDLPADDFLMRQAILTKAPTLSLAEPDKGLAAVLRRALAKDPAARYRDAAELHSHLKAAWRA